MVIRLLLLSFLFVPASYADDIENAVTITEKECRKLIRIHDINGAEYVPDTDSRGNKLVPADLNGGNQITLPKEITFDLGVDLAERYNLGTGVYGKADLGQVKVKGQNVYWNGQKLAQTENDAILEACRAQYTEK
ncbi:hypothetical protein [Terasakiella pusilla]|uniref:hypothetical protein n=1 Tax=Terasakiella pusilla TaxID=64973 RepID=UPI00048C5AD1|nr:hypothetical protein [Terasakiella pusilla]